MPDELPWTWALAEDGIRFAALPEAESEHVLPPGQAYAALAIAANDQSAMVVLVGWDRLAWHLLTADPVLCAKTVVWLLPPGQMAHLAAAAAAGPRPGELLVTAYDGPDHLPLLMDRLPLLCWGLVSLDADTTLLERIQNLRRQRLYAAYQVAERTLTDLGHLLAREDRIARAIPLSTWNGAWRGRTALCIAAGPSLDDHLPMVRASMDRCLVVCADIIHRRVADAGIKIDFVVNVDSHELIAERMGASDDPSTVLVMPLGGHRALDSRFPRCSYVGGDALADHLLGPGNVFGHGTNVGGATVGFAAFAGCTELILVGHDLSFAKDRYYSTLVNARDSLEKRSLDLSLTHPTEVEGNDGKPVLTNGNFKVGIRDLGMMAGHLRKFDVVVRNPNINRGIGARIAFTEPMPEGWQPQGDGPSPRPARGAASQVQVPAGGVRQVVRSALSAFDARWRSGDRPLVQRLNTIDDDLQARLGQQIALPFILGLVVHAFRLQTMPARVQRQAGTAATEALAGPMMDVAIAAMNGVLERGDWTPPERQAPWSARQRAFFIELRPRIPLIPVGSIDDVLIPLIARDWRSLLDAAPSAPLPPPHGFFDAIHVCASLGERTPPWYVHETLAHCMLAAQVGLGYVLDLAQAAGVVTAAELDPATAGAGPHASLAAMRALRRLEGGMSADHHADAELAVAWPPAQVAAVRALLRGGHATIATALLRDGRLHVDDILAEAVLRGHPDTLVAIESLEPYQPSFGEGVTMAIAERHMAIGEHAHALAHLERIRMLSDRAGDALPLVYDCLAAVRGLDAVSERFAAFPDRSKAVSAFHAFLVRRLGRRNAVHALLGCNLDPLPAALLTDILSGLMSSHEVDAASAAAVAVMAQRAKASADAAELKALELVGSLAERATVISS